MAEKHDIQLPRRDENGEYYISYSQFTTWRDDVSFNMGVKGSIEYMAAYFMGESWPDQGWAQFGSEVEDYICHRKFADKFDAQERAFLDAVPPLGNFQIEIKHYILPGVYIKGFIDDALPDMTRIRDYKTLSASNKKYEKDSYVQLDIYAGAVQKLTGKIPEIEVCGIPRTGNCFGLVERRDLLKVGGPHKIIPRVTSQERIDSVMAELITAVFQISEAYKFFLKMNLIPN